ncbi:conserved hypothetical protein [Desulfovibrionales bacterium]
MIAVTTDDRFMSSTGSKLLPHLPWAAAAELVRYEAVLAEVLRLSPRYRRELPRAVAELSARLTLWRGKLTSDYLQSPAAQTAYLSYFLPWNLLRLTTLLSGLTAAGFDPLPMFSTDEAKGPPLLLDLGAGPLTLTQALWIARPDLRERSLMIVAVDRSRRILQMGIDLFRRLTGSGLKYEGPWRIVIIPATLEQSLVSLRGRPDLLVMANVLNELPWSRREPLDDQVARLLGRLMGRMGWRGEGEGRGRLLLVEPGNRLGGKLLAIFRQAGLGRDFVPLAPCTHVAACPFLSRLASSWCHFTFPVQDAPDWLLSLSECSGLTKDRAAVSFLLLAQTKVVGPAAGVGRARILSESFVVIGPDGKPSRGRYACGVEGVLLLLDGAFDIDGVVVHDDLLRPGGVVGYWADAAGRRDAKSGALYAMTYR